MRHGIMILIFVLYITTPLTVFALPLMRVESPSDVYCGRNFTVNISVDPRGDEVFSAEYELRFNQTALHAYSQTNGTFLSQDGVETIVQGIIGDGVLTYSETRKGDPFIVGGVTEAGVLGIIKFHAEEPCVCMLNITEARVVVYDRANDTYYPVNVELSNGTVVVNPPEPFNITGCVFYENGSACENPNVIVENLNTSAKWNASTVFNRYTLNLKYGPDVLVGEVLRFNVSSADGFMNISYHTVTADDVKSGGIHLNITVRKPRRPDIVVTDVWVCWPHNCTICYNITNIGDGYAHAGHKTVLFVDFSEVTYDIVPVKLAPGESYVGCFDYSWTYTPPKDEIMVCADYDDIVEERDETNNRISTIWKCGDVAPPYGYVTGFDVARLNNYVAGLCEINEWAGDVAPPYGYVTGFDVARLNNYVAGLCEMSCMCSQK